MKTVVALGAELKSNFSIMSDKGLYTAKDAGDLSLVESSNEFKQNLNEKITEYNITPQVIACDIHPDYVSTKMAENLTGKNSSLKLLKVQHHFAHIAACMLDNDINEEVIGISFDGTGYGTDGASWGGEFLVCTRKEFQRKYHLAYVPQPGADVAAREAWRMAASYLYEAFAEDAKKISSFVNRVGEKKIDIIFKMIEKDINSPRTSSVGRLFDAVSSITGICDRSSFEAEAAILLEKEAKSGVRAFYDYDIESNQIQVKKMIRAIIRDLSDGEDTGVVAAKFHNTIGEIIFGVAKRISEDTGLSKVLISGGCFQNKYLVGYLEKRFASSELKLYKHKDYSATDLGISIGQAVVASSM